MQDDPWAQFRVQPAAQPQQPPPQQAPVIGGRRVIGSTPPSEIRAEEDQALERQRFANQQAVEAERLRLARDAEARQADEAARKREQAASGFDATEGERKAAAFLLRALGSNTAYEGAGVGPRSLVGQAAKDTFPNATNYFTSGERQAAESAQDEFIAASLRQDSGAAIPPEELERQRRIYFPMPGDGPEAIEQKRQARLRAIAGLEQSSGRLKAQTIQEWNRLGLGALQTALERGASKEEILDIAQRNNLSVDEEALDANIRSRDAGGTVNSFVPPTDGPSGGGGGGVVQDIGTSLANTAVGYLQGAGEAVVDFPLQVASAVQTGTNALLDTVIGGGLEAVGATDAAQAFRETGRIDNERRAALSTPVANAFNTLAPPPPGYELQRDVARFGGGMLVPFGPKGKPPIRAPQAAQPASNASQIIAEGAKRGVDVLTTDVVPPKGATGRYIKQTLPEKIPFAGTAGVRAEQQAQRQAAVRDVVEEFGGDTGRSLFDDTISPAEEVSKLLTAQRSARISNLKTAKDSVIDGIAAPFQAAPNTVRAIDEQVRRLSEIDAEEFAPVIDRLQRFKERITSGGSLRTVEEQRRLLGALFEDTSLARIKDRGQQAINAIYDPLRKDMGDFIEAQGGSAARAKWAKANEELAAMAGELKSTRFRNVLRDADTSPEAVGRILFSGTSDVSDMRRLVANLDADGLRKVQGAILARAFDNAGGAQGVSVEQFLGNLKRFKEQIGVAFTGQDREAVEGLRKLLEATRRGAEAGANIRTGEQNLPTILGIGATQALGFAGGVSTLGVGGLLARVYESAPTRNLLVRLSKTQPGSKQESETLNLLMRAAAPTVNTWRENVARAVNDNTAGALAAEEQQPIEQQ